MPVRDDQWYCQVCDNVTAPRDEATETMHVARMSCPICQRVTKHATIISDKNQVRVP